MKCQKCTKAATMHITELLEEEKFREVHLCEDCAQKYLQEPIGTLTLTNPDVPAGDESDELPQVKAECAVCGIKFVEFRNSGRLGCANDYVEFRDELMPLLENIHGETRHAGKTPRRLPQLRKTQGELVQLRKALQSAVTREAYEEAARIRDAIRRLENA